MYTYTDTHTLPTPPKKNIFWKRPVSLQQWQISRNNIGQLPEGQRRQCVTNSACAITPANALPVNEKWMFSFPFLSLPNLFLWIAWSLPFKNICWLSVLICISFNLNNYSYIFKLIFKEALDKIDLIWLGFLASLRLSNISTAFSLRFPPHTLFGKVIFIWFSTWWPVKQSNKFKNFRKCHSQKIETSL